MPAQSSRLRFFVDESALGLGKSLAIARADVVHTGHRLVLPDIPLGALDPDWMPRVASRDLVVISRDRHIRTKPGELALLRSHHMRVLYIGEKRNLTTWDQLVRLVERWSDIEALLLARPTGPWFYTIGLRKLMEVRV